VIQSTDKNFMVPVGCSLVFSKERALLKAIAETYPGRAAASGITDLFITLLEMGSKTWTRLLQDRMLLYERLRARLSEFL
jgi:O-phospho-L-seryl-tRNASec:L-selenocysteinyl-tRNA synthase